MNTLDVRYPNGFFLPKSDAREYVDALAEALLSSPEWIQDDIEVLESGIADHKQALAQAEQDLAERQQALAAAYALPANDRRVGDAVNVTNAEFCCCIIEPSCKLESLPFGLHRFWVEWETGATRKSCITAQDAWQETFRQLDRRSGGAK